MHLMPRVSIIILNWNGWKDTVECLESVYRIAYPNYDVIVVDNGSRDESLKKVKDYANGQIAVESNFLCYPTEKKSLPYIEYSRTRAETGGGKEDQISGFPSNRRLILIENEKNYGFAEGNNIAIRYALKTLNPDYLLLLNNDTVVEENFLSELIRVASQDEKNGILGSKVYYYNYRGQRDIIHSAGAHINTKFGLCPPIGLSEKDRGQYDEVRRVDYVEGACMLVKRNVIDTIGLLDPIFFAYWEETDWCCRADKKGYNVIYVPQAKIWHKIPERKVSKLSTYLLTRNRFIFMRKNAEVQELYIFLLYFILFDFWYRLAVILIYDRNPGTLLSPYVRGVYDGLKVLFDSSIKPIFPVN